MIIKNAELLPIGTSKKIKKIEKENETLNNLISHFDMELGKYFNRVKLARSKLENINDISEDIKKELLEILVLD